MGFFENLKILLISGSKVIKIMLVIFFLKWYLEYGLNVIRIYIVVELVLMNCFFEFIKNILEIRRKGDCDKFLIVVFDIVKVEGNLVYGSFLLNKDKFVNIKFIEGVENVLKKVNELLFVKLIELDSVNNYYEI